MNLLLKESDGPPKRFVVDGDCALVGRASHCDVVIDDEFVSKLHLKVLRGVVVVDMSTNGTFVDGERIEGGIVLGARRAQIGTSDITISVEPEPSQSDLASDAAGSNEVEAALRVEIETLKGKLAAQEKAAREQLEQALEATPAPPADASAASLLVFKLQQENSVLKRELAQSKAAAEVEAEVARRATPPPSDPSPTTPPAAAPGNPSDTAQPVSPPRSSVVPPAKDATPHPVGAPPAASAPIAPAAFAGFAGSGGRALARLSELVQRDAEAIATTPDEPLDSFLVLESFRFLRRVERVVTRLAGGLIQLYQLHTVVPGVEGNLRELLAGVLQNPNSSGDRDALLEYLHELGRWMVVALGAYRQAAEKFAMQMKDDLSLEGLTSADPVSAVKRMSGKTEAELWRRVCAYLRDLSPDTVNERVETLARAAADELIDSDSSETFS